MEPRTEAGKRLAETLSTVPHRQWRPERATFEADILAIEEEARTVNPEGLDAAWTEAEAALPRDWSFGLTPYWQDDRWYGWEIEAHHSDYEFDGGPLGTGTLGAFTTPAAALRSLAARLRAEGTDRRSATPSSSPRTPTDG